MKEESLSEQTIDLLIKAVSALEKLKLELVKDQRFDNAGTIREVQKSIRQLIRLNQLNIDKP